jgi:hypothetical protein
MKNLDKNLIDLKREMLLLVDKAYLEGKQEGLRKAKEIYDSVYNKHEKH